MIALLQRVTHADVIVQNTTIGEIGNGILVFGEKLFNYFVAKTQKKYHKIAIGKFGANMQVNLCNDGPVTFILKA